MTKCNSLENINLQFRAIMGKMGLDEEKQNRLTVKMDLTRKIKTIISMQSLDERKKKIKEYLDRIENANSLMSLLSLHSSIENGSKTLFSIFMSTKGPEIVLKSMKVMQGDYVYAVLEFIEMLLHKYDCEIPGLLEEVLGKFLEMKCGSPAFFRILEECVKKGEYEILFRSTTPFGCVCSSYFSLVVQEMGEGDSRFVEELRKTDKKDYVDYVMKIHNRRIVDVDGVRGCRSERLFEVIRIAEEKKMVEIVTNAIETLVLGSGKIPLVDVGEGGKVDGDVKGDVKNEVVDEVKKDLKLVSPTTASLIPTSSTPPPTNTTPTSSTSSTKPTKKKIIKKVTKPRKNYDQLKWTRIPKEGTIFEMIPKGVEFTEKDLEPFLKAETQAPKASLVKKRETLFPEKKNYALNIALSRVKLTDSELKKRILRLEDCESNLVKQLLLYFPTDEEIDSLRGLTTPCGRAESFFKEALEEIDDLKEALTTLHFKILLESQDVQGFTTLAQYYSTLLSSTSLREILAFILGLGNSLNPTKAEAFTLLSLGQVFENKKVLGLLKERVDLKPFLREFKILYDVQRLSFENLQGDFLQLYDKRVTSRNVLKEKYEMIEKKYKEVLGLHTQAQDYLKEKIDEDFNQQFLGIYEALK